MIATDWNQILITHGFDVPIDKDEFNILCPFHVDSVPSCAINTIKGLWICFRGCGQGSLKYFMQKHLGVPWNEVDSQLDNSQWSLDLWDDLKTMIEEPELDVQLPDGFKIPDNHWIFRRGFSRETLENAGCIVNKYGDLIVPVYDAAQNLKGYISRRQQATPKYMYSYGFRKSTVLFGGDVVTKASKVYVTEGALDALWLRQHGYPAVAVLGAHISKEQIRLINKLYPEEVILCLDNDEAGQIGIRKALVDMEQSYMVSYIVIPKGYKDVQDIHNSKVLTKVIQDREYW
jgi:DNA primase